MNAYIGVQEATGKNDGPVVERFLQSVKMPAGYAWCAAFVHYVLEKCGVKTNISAWAPSAVTQSRRVWQKGQKVVRDPLPADVFGLYFPKMRRIGHVGFIKKWNTGTAYTITVEGNTDAVGSREGGGVWEKYRLKSQIHSVSDWIGI